MITEIKIYPETNTVQVISEEGAVQFTAEGDVLGELLIACEGEVSKTLDVKEEMEVEEVSE